MRVSAWLALTKDVRGLLWYAWDERNGTGMVNFPSLQETMKEILGQLNELMPALLATVRRPFVEGRVNGIVYRHGNDVTVLVVNMGGDMVPVPEVPEFRGRKVKAMFGMPEASEPLGPLECRAYTTMQK